MSSLTDAVAILQGNWAGVASNILHDRAVLWIGSGISREKFPPLSGLLERLFSELYARQDVHNPDCPYRLATRQIIAISTVGGIDVTEDPAMWDHGEKSNLITQLTTRYSEVLQISVIVGGVAQSLPWQILTLQDVYSDSAVTPDAEHRLLALLIAEGAVSEIITTNWDPLIERAYTELRCEPALKIVACNAELNQQGLGALIFKIHGCAQKRKDDPTHYAEYMVASLSDITTWNQGPVFQAFRDAVRTMLRTKPAVFIGLSGQDFNLQAEWVNVNVGGVEYAINPSRITFTVNQINAAQSAMLSAVYGDRYGQNIVAINAAAALPLLAKPLLGALYILLIFEKLRLLLTRGEEQFPSNEYQNLARTHVDLLLELIKARYDAIGDQLLRWRSLAQEVPGFIARFIGLYRNQKMPPDFTTYIPINTRHTERMNLEPDLVASNLHWLILAGSLLMEGQRRRMWEIQIPVLTTGADGQLLARIGAVNVTLYLLNRPDSAITRLESENVLVPGTARPVLVVYPAGVRPARRHGSPRRPLPGGASHGIVSEIWFEDIAKEGLAVDELLDIIRSALIAANPI